MYSVLLWGISIIYLHIIIGGSTPLECTNGVVVALAVTLALVVVLSLIIIAALALCLFQNKRSTTTHASKASSTTTL
jgi:hypothetical protein